MAILLNANLHCISSLLVSFLLMVDLKRQKFSTGIQYLHCQFLGWVTVPVLFSLDCLYIST